MTTDDDMMVSWRLGHMWNVSRTSALGVAGALEVARGPVFGLQPPRLGFLARYRQWITQSRAAELSTSVFTRYVEESAYIGTNYQTASYKGIGFTGAVSYTFSPAFGMSARIEVVEPLKQSPFNLRWIASGPAWPVSVWLGARVAGKPGILVGPAAAILVGLIAFGEALQQP